ncbi:MAG: ParB N-terminal domain-containing protein [Bdellovibrionota bacterium]|nr:ParB N-terminal domain-containing protein [Bdellovibrionota bacterium]
MEYVNIDTIIVNNPYLRLDTDVEKLMKSIETVGLINPIVVNEKNELIAGGRRYTALKAMGRTEVPVSRVEKTEIEQELISIDENLVRLDLGKVEMEQLLARGRNLYESLFPEAVKTDEEDLSTPAGNEIQKDLPNDKRSFIDLTAEKTGLSKKVIKSAIEREEKSSDTVKSLRRHGELNASQANQIIKLDKEEQEKVVDHLVGKSAKEMRQFVEQAKKKGVDEALDEYLNAPQLPKEFDSLKTLMKRTNKVLAKILLEEMASDHDDVSDILDQMSTLRMSMDQFLQLCSNGPKASMEQASDEDYQNLADEAIGVLNNTDEANPEEAQW